MRKTPDIGFRVQGLGFIIEIPKSETAKYSKGFNAVPHGLACVSAAVGFSGALSSEFIWEYCGDYE